jgi:REP element-mobilizing transposase RayT
MSGRNGLNDTGRWRIPAEAFGTFIMAHEDPIAWFITWTVYGCHLQGALTGWRKIGKGEQPPQPRLEQWHRERLNHDVLTLNADQRLVVEAEIQKHCKHRGWTLWAANARSTHVHVVVTAVDVPSKTIRDQLKANCTRALREKWADFRERPAWTVGGDRDPVNDEDSLERVVEYVRDAQDRKGRDEETGR